MKIKFYISAFLICALGSVHLYSQTNDTIRFNFCDQPVEFRFDRSNFIDFTAPLSDDSIRLFYDKLCQTNYQPVVNAILAYRDRYKLSDWLFYQLVRRTAQHLSPKAENYNRYTLYKWFLLGRSGYNTTLSISGDKVLFYVQSNDSIYNIPCHFKDGKQYVCLNYHDYGMIDFDKNKFSEITITIPEAKKAFSYKITQLPDFKPADY